MEAGNRPILTRILKNLSTLGACNGLYVITNGRFYKAMDIWRKNVHFACNVIIVNDETLSNEDRLGAINDLYLVLKQAKVDDDMLVVAGDNLFEFDIRDFHAFAKQKYPYVCVALFDVKSKLLARQYGTAVIDSRNKILEFQEKAKEPKSTLASTAVYFFP